MKIALRTRILGAMLLGFVLPCLLGLLLLAQSMLLALSNLTNRAHRSIFYLP